ncbi:hypothetical protein V6N12_025699 [Hibiscus sabdariffa]|uniref:RecA family profile 1 domain-containing protein n=1 Tax=Hibiscus sabdariffa TaxID=183260 RepID=A0ABR1ZFU4_9ROSI
MERFRWRHGCEEIREKDGKKDKGEYWHWGFEFLTLCFCFGSGGQLATTPAVKARLLSAALFIAGGSDHVVLVAPYEVVEPYIRPSLWALESNFQAEDELKKRRRLFSSFSISSLVKYMAPLKNLETEYPIIDPSFRKFCASHGIFSVEDFLIHDLYMLAAFAEQDISSERLKEGITQVLSIIDDMHQPWWNGMELLEDAKRNKHVLPTGIQGIDLLLGGGIHIGQLTELVGPSSSGKTQVCLQTASNVASNHMVLYIDTSNSFSPERIAYFLGKIIDVASAQAKNQILQKVMSNILCHSVFDIFAMFDVLHQLESHLRYQDAGGCQMRLLIVDSISLLISPVLGSSSTQGRALMLSAGYLLKKLAHQHNLAVLVINHTVGGEGGCSKPALGDSWKSIPHSRLFLSCVRGSNDYNALILKHPSMDQPLQDDTSIGSRERNFIDLGIGID